MVEQDDDVGVRPRCNGADMCEQFVKRQVAQWKRTVENIPEKCKKYP